MEAGVARAHPGDLHHTLFNGRALGFDLKRGDGQCQQCMGKHASGVCKTSATGLDTDRAMPSRLATPANMAGNAIVGICMMRSVGELGNGG
jgi:hypothetical protein